MQQMQALIGILLMFLIIILIGYILRSKNKIHENLQNDLSFILMKITLPCLIFASIAQPFNQSLMQQGVGTFAIMLVCLLIGSIVGFISMKVFHVEPGQRGIWLLGVTFSNICFMGYPVINTMYGSHGMFIASFANIAFNITYYTFGAMMVIGKKEKEPFDWKGVFLNNIMISILVGLIFYFARIEVGGFVKNTINTVGNLTTPLAMLIIGLKLGEFPLKEVFNNIKQYQLCLVRLILFPIVIVCFFKILPIEQNSLMLIVLIILNAMPMSANSTAMANMYGGDAAFAAKATTLSSILCLITLPIILLLA